MLKNFVKIKDLQIYYEKEGSGEPILILHGWGGRTESVKPIFDLLKTKFCVYSLDLPGFGRSEIPKDAWGTSDYGLFIKEFLENFGIKKINIIGHSLGGRIGIWLSANYPELVNRLVLVDASGIKPKRKPAYYLKVLLAKIAKYLLPKALKEKVYQKIGSKDYKEAGKMRDTLVKIVNEEIKPFLSKILAPTLIIWGENDFQTPIYQGKIMEKEIKNSSLKIIKNAGHFCYLDNSFDFSNAILDFFK
ncbi:MAG: alpha/beta hydrolase [bacterium]